MKHSALNSTPRTAEQPASSVAWAWSTCFPRSCDSARPSTSPMRFASRRRVSRSSKEDVTTAQNTKARPANGPWNVSMWRT